MVAFLARSLSAAAIVIALSGCLQTGYPPVAERSPVKAGERHSVRTYTVRKGDTLYSIAWRYEADVAELAQRNGIRAPYTIFPGQQLRLVPESAAPSPVSKAPARKPQPARTVASVDWRKPVETAPVQRFGRGNKGWNYTLAHGARVRSTRDGEVVYAGSGLGGFVHLVIVRHDAEYLSAYSLNVPIRVKESQKIKAGHILADIDTKGRGELSARRAATVHFEVRSHGKPVDPSTLLR